jgi:hypothetical protein
MASDNIADRAIAYLALTDYPIFCRIEGFVPDPEHPRFCLKYLLDCVTANVQADLEGDLHDRGMALYELSIPLSRVWENRGVGISPTEYWETIEGFLRSSSLDVMDDFVTHFLEGDVYSMGFRDRLVVWQADPLLGKYLLHLDHVLGRA